MPLCHRTKPKASPRRLRPKQRLFVEEYLVDLNATQAAIRAGYSLRTAGAIGGENLAKPGIARAIQESFSQVAKRIGITQEWTLRRLYENVERAMQAVPVLDQDGQPIGEYRYEGHVANRGLEMALKYLGLLQPESEKPPAVVVNLALEQNFDHNAFIALFRHFAGQVDGDGPGLPPGNGAGEPLDTDNPNT